jgi:signal transduction histidine kinase
VRKEDDLWAFLIYDVSDNQRLKQQLIAALIGVVLVFSVLSFMLGASASRRVMKPVSDLAARLDTLSEEGKPERLSVHFADDEVGQLADALDSYADRLHHLVERDREFNADVSHELRSPLTVITGATELLLAQPDLDEKVRTRLLRIARAARQSADITTALLHLVRAERRSHREGRGASARTADRQQIAGAARGRRGPGQRYRPRVGGGRDGGQPDRQRDALYPEW